MLFQVHDIRAADESEQNEFMDAGHDAVRFLHAAITPESLSKTTHTAGGDAEATGAMPHWCVFETLKRISQNRIECGFFYGPNRTWRQDMDAAYALSHNEEYAKAISIVFSLINDLLIYNAFGECDEALRSVDIDRLPNSVRLAFLTFTFAAREHLESRHALYERTWERIATDDGQQVAEQLLKTLK